MKKNTVVINGVEYSCRLTLGVIKEFKDKTGREITEIGSNITDIGTLVYLSVSKSCKAARVVIPWQNEEELLDDLELSDLPAMTAALFGEQTEEQEAKKNEISESTN